MNPAKRNELGIFIDSLDMETDTLTDSLNNGKYSATQENSSLLWN
jgi:hypothetical protein